MTRNVEKQRSTAPGTTDSAVTEQREAKVCEPPDSDCKVIVPEKPSDLRETTDRQASDMKRHANKTERSTEKKKKSQTSRNSGTE